MSGFVFLLCCHAKKTEAATCPLMRLGARCDKAQKAKDAERIEKQSKDEGIDCCAFIPAFFDKTRTLDAHDQIAVAAPLAKLVGPRVTDRFSNFAPQHTYPSAVLPGNDTFLKNKAFRL